MSKKRIQSVATRYGVKAHFSSTPITTQNLRAYMARLAEDQPTQWGWFENASKRDEAKILKRAKKVAWALEENEDD